ncbi:MAG: SulP family inorganic anion transporter [Candidatus Marithrix sp.]
MQKFQRFLPFLNWFPMSRDTVKADLIASITVALVLIPQSMAYAKLAGLPAYYGLYTAFLPVLIAALFGSSNQLSTGPVAVVSLLTAASITQFAEIGSPEFISLAIMLAFLVGIFQLLLGIFRLGLITNFLSYPVIIGFTNAAALIIALSQLNKILGISMPRSEYFLIDVWNMIMQIGNIHVPTLIFGLIAFAIMWLLKNNYPKIPGILIAVTITIIISWLINFQVVMGGEIVGKIPEGLPSFSIPNFNTTILGEIITSAMVIALIGFMEAISIAKAMAIKTKQHIDPNQELIGQGFANIIGSFTQAYPASGSFSRSAVNLNTGAKTGMSSVYTAVIMMITLLFLTPLLYHLPKAVLAAVIMMAVFGLINFTTIKHIWKTSKLDGIIAIVTFVATISSAPHLEKGILLGFGLAVILYFYRIYCR